MQLLSTFCTQPVVVKPHVTIVMCATGYRTQVVWGTEVVILFVKYVVFIWSLSLPEKSLIYSRTKLFYLSTIVAREEPNLL